MTVKRIVFALVTVLFSVGIVAAADSTPAPCPCRDNCKCVPAPGGAGTCGSYLCRANGGRASPADGRRFLPGVDAPVGAIIWIDGKPFVVIERIPAPTAPGCPGGVCPNCPGGVCPIPKK